MFGLKLVDKELYKIEKEMLQILQELHESDEQTINAYENLVAASEDLIAHLYKMIDWYKNELDRLRANEEEGGEAIEN